MARLGLFGQVIPKIGMGNIDQSLRPLVQILAMKVGHSVFCDDVLNICSGGDHAGSLLEHGDDPRRLTLLGRRRKGDYGFTSLGMGCASDKINLSPETAVDKGAYRV